MKCLSSGSLCHLSCKRYGTKTLFVASRFSISYYSTSDWILTPTHAHIFITIVTLNHNNNTKCHIHTCMKRSVNNNNNNKYTHAKGEHLYTVLRFHCALLVHVYVFAWVYVCICVCVLVRVGKCKTATMYTVHSSTHTQYGKLNSKPSGIGNARYTLIHMHTHWHAHLVPKKIVLTISSPFMNDSFFIRVCWNTVDGCE